MISSLLRTESPLMKDLGLLTLRAGTGAIMLFAHGLGKLQAWGEKAETWPDPLGVSPTVSFALTVFAEVFCSILLMMGALTRLAVIPPLVTMVVAHFVIHAQDTFQVKELSLLYLLVFTSIFLLGPGRFSVDGALLKKN